MSRKVLSWIEKIEQQERKYLNRELIKGIYKTSKKSVPSYKWVVTSLKSNVKVYFRKYVVVNQYMNMIVIHGKNKDIWFYPTKNFKIELCN